MEAPLLASDDAAFGSSSMLMNSIGNNEHEEVNMDGGTSTLSRLIVESSFSNANNPDHVNNTILLEHDLMARRSRRRRKEQRRMQLLQQQHQQEEQQPITYETCYVTIITLTLSILMWCFIWASYVQDSWCDTHLLLNFQSSLGTAVRSTTGDNKIMDSLLSLIDAVTNVKIHHLGLASLTQDLLSSSSHHHYFHHVVLLIYVWVTYLLIPCMFLIFIPFWIYYDYMEYNQISRTFDDFLSSLCCYIGSSSSSSSNSSTSTAYRNYVQYTLRFSYSIFYILLIMFIVTSYVQIQFEQQQSAPTTMSPAGAFASIYNTWDIGILCFFIAIMCSMITVIILRFKQKIIVAKRAMAFNTRTTTITTNQPLEVGDNHDNNDYVHLSSSFHQQPQSEQEVHPYDDQQQSQQQQQQQQQQQELVEIVPEEPFLEESTTRLTQSLLPPPSSSTPVGGGGGFSDNNMQQQQQQQHHQHSLPPVIQEMVNTSKQYKDNASFCKRFMLLQMGIIIGILYYPIFQETLFHVTYNGFISDFMIPQQTYQKIKLYHIPKILADTIKHSNSNQEDNGVPGITAIFLLLLFTFTIIIIPILCHVLAFLISILPHHNHPNNSSNTGSGSGNSSKSCYYNYNFMIKRIKRALYMLHPTICNLCFILTIILFVPSLQDIMSIVINNHDSSSTNNEQNHHNTKTIIPFCDMVSKITQGDDCIIIEGVLHKQGCLFFFFHAILLEVYLYCTLKWTL